jgi:pimeloyl-ACP methyl ester carboxylesterase
MKQRLMSLIVSATLLALMVTACSSPTPTSQPPGTEEITFKSGSFSVVGDLRTPGGRRGPYPVVLFVHGSGPADRTGAGSYLPVMERILQAGYATFSWDKPGTGESTGRLDDRHVQSQRAQILLDAIEVMKAHADIDPRQIGLWGISQAGYVMPRVLAQSEDIAFMICVSCAGMSGSDQMAFQVTALALCDGVPEEKADEKTRLLAELDTARAYETYEEYMHYREVLAALAKLESAPIEKWPLLSEDTWQKCDPDLEAHWNPVGLIEQVRIPVLAIFGDRDRQIDPLQGAHAYRQALGQAGNPKSRVTLFPRANHGIAVSDTGCPGEDGQRFEQYVKTLGYGSISEAQEAILKDPYKPGSLGDPPFAPGYLNLIEEWLRDLRR